MSTLAIVPTYITNDPDLLVTAYSIKTLIDTTSNDCEIFVIDNGSTHKKALDKFRSWLPRSGEKKRITSEFLPKGHTFTYAINEGLRKARDESLDALVVKPDIEFFEKDWLEALRDTDSVISGPLTFLPEQLIYSAGIYYSVLSREFGHRYQYSPWNLPEAQVGEVCPVTGSCMLIRHRLLEKIGFFDEDLEAYEDLDYCLRTFQTGERSCYQPLSRIKRRPTFEVQDDEAWIRLQEKHMGESFGFMPTLLDHKEPVGMVETKWN